ncbi:MAG: MBL fold metallo-hydrolase [Fimbriiglobus sp.]|jgi:phosphoribosyl 1,2-cyclic phosphodiesterase|nr:MBL fold metallo-hydrolase [Fimbriiglobus sp.]
MTTHRMTVLASGSAGNATLIEADGFGLLVDCGLPPQELTARMGAVGLGWPSVNAVVITHTHSDHWNRYTLEHLRRLNIPFFAHPRHHTTLATHAAYGPLARAGLTRDYRPGEPISLGGGLSLNAVQVPHDSDPTFAVRVDYSCDGDGWAVGIASDLGRVPDGLYELFAGVDVLGLEFNHCVQMQRASRRPRFLVERVLGDFGHLSNRQAADAVRLFTGMGDLTALVQLHLSRDCNTAELAMAAGQEALNAAGSSATLVTATQWHPAASVPLVPHPPRAALRRRRSVQPSLPGFEAD